MLELSGKEKMMPYKLSGGEQQRVAISEELWLLNLKLFF